MNKSKNKLICIKNMFNILLGAVIIIISFILFVKSFEIYKDNSGTDISFNNTYVISLLIGIVVTIYGIIRIKNDKLIYYHISGIIISSLLGCYALGTFFKALGKAISKKRDFIFSDYQAYLYIGIVGLLILGYYITAFAISKKELED